MPFNLGLFPRAIKGGDERPQADSSLGASWLHRSEGLQFWTSDQLPQRGDKTRLVPIIQGPRSGVRSGTTPITRWRQAGEQHRRGARGLGSLRAPPGRQTQGFGPWPQAREDRGVDLSAGCPALRDHPWIFRELQPSGGDRPLQSRV